MTVATARFQTDGKAIQYARRESKAANSTVMVVESPNKENDATFYAQDAEEVGMIGCRERLVATFVNGERE